MVINKKNENENLQGESASRMRNEEKWFARRRKK
jgi:hypothetical protein